MADAARGGGGFGARGGDRGRGRGRGRGRRGAKSEEKEWQPVTKLGRLVKAGKIKSMEEIYLHSLPIKEFQIVDFFLPKLKDEVMKVRLTSQKRKPWGQHLLTCKYLDQTSSETDSGWSEDKIQSYCGYRRFRRPHRTWYQNIKRSRYRYTCCYYHCQA